MLLATTLVLAAGLVYLLIQLFMGRVDAAAFLPFAEGLVEALLWYSVFHEVQHIFTAIADSGTPFTMLAEQSLRRIGTSLLLLAAAELVFQMLAEVITYGAAPSFIISWGYGSVASDWIRMSAEASSRGAVVVSVGSFVVPGIVFALAHAFAYGRSLQDEADHTL